MPDQVIKNFTILEKVTRTKFQSIDLCLMTDATNPNLTSFLRDTVGWKEDEVKCEASAEEAAWENFASHTHNSPQVERKKRGKGRLEMDRSFAMP